jgi:WhiB family transcriptional regulator, redox-sensing transcriptional regulator
LANARGREPVAAVATSPGKFRRGIDMDMDWRSRAACRAEEPELFFPVGTSGPALVQTARATAVCRRCPVMIRCRDWALTTGQTTGVWGGMSEVQRRAARWQQGRDLPLPRGR